MNLRKRIVSLAALTLLASGTLAIGEEAPARRPLMAALNQVGLAKSLEDANINIYGFLEGSYTYNFSAANDGINEFRVFDYRKNDCQFNQTDLTIERTVDVTKNQFDIGGRVEFIWGTDAALIHSNGLFDWYDAIDDQDYQWDLNQAYVDFAVPVGNGLRIRAGKYVTPMGQETINPTTNALFSHSFLFGYAIPFTHTGVTGTYAIDDNWTIEGGLFRGWEQSLEDISDGCSWQAKMAYTSTDKLWTGILQLVTGPEQADNTSDYRTVVDVIFSYTPDPKGSWTFAVNGDWGCESSVPGIGDAQWYGVAGYGGYKISDMLTANCRGEWFRDDDGARTGVSQSLFEVTLGVSIRPMPADPIVSNLVIRPEVRWDHSTEPVFDAGTDHDQFTFGVDAIFTF